MHDPLEGVTSLGMIKTGASRDRVPELYEPVLAAAVESLADQDTSLYLYGSVATGRAQRPRSDVDLLTVGLSPAAATGTAQELTTQFQDICRAVEIAPAQGDDFLGTTDAAYGGRVFLRHYCLHLAGPDLHSVLPDFAADARAARGFNGDIAQHAARWRTELANGRGAAPLGRRMARKSLLAVAGLVSVHDNTWTTDRTVAAARWAEIEPESAGELDMLLQWSDGNSTAERRTALAALDGVVAEIVDSFAELIGLWDHPG